MKKEKLRYNIGHQYNIHHFSSKKKFSPFFFSFVNLTMGTITPLSTLDPEYQNIVTYFNISPSFYTIHSILRIEMDWFFTSRFDSVMMWTWENRLRLFHGTKHTC